MRPVEGWFRARGWKPFRFQREAWSAYLDGKSGLVHAATGTGKTQAAWMGPLIEALIEGRAEEPPPLRVLWITPLRALANDTLQALRDPAEFLETGWAVGLRRGDTSQAERRRQRERLPTALVTTPESLCLFLATPGQQETFSGRRCLVVDEWHELFGTQRGVLLELALARLRAIAPQPRIWGLSATLGNTDEAARALAGEKAVLVKADLPKKVVVDAAIPREMERFPWAGHIGTRLLGDVIEAIEGSRSALIFTNVRSQTEIWHRAILEARPDWEDAVAIHHGSLDRERRGEVEQGLREGRLVHEGLAALFAWRIAKRVRATFSLACNDHGFELLSASRVDVEAALAKRHFREVARIAGLVVPGWPRGARPARKVQASAELFYDVFARYDPGNLLLHQAGREVLERLRASRIEVVDLERPTPFAFPLMVDRLRETLTNERLEDRVRRMRLDLESAAVPVRGPGRR